MAGRLKNEIKQRRPFGSLEEEVFLSTLRTADHLSAPVNEILKRENLSMSQYNVLRILRGASGEPLPCGEIGERMVSRDPDLTRLLDRLESRGLVERARGVTDRRVVHATITSEGLRLLETLDGAIASAMKEALAHMSPERLEQLRELLDEARSPQ